MKRTGKFVITLVMAWLLVLTAACAPIPEEITPPDKVTTPEESTTPKEVTPEPTPTVEWGIIEIRVTDPPPADVKSAVVYLSNVEVHKAVAEQEREQEQEQSTGDNQTQEQEQEQEQEQTQQREGGWIPVIGAPPSFDLMDVIGITEVLGSANVTAGKYTQIRMDVDRVEVVTVDGDNFTAEVPSGKLKIVGPFSVEAGGETTLTLDFDGEKSLIITGKGKALFKPVVKLLIEEKGKPEDKGKPESGETEELEFEGTIDAMDGNIWTMTIEGETRTVDVSEAEIEGEPVVGLQAKVEGTVADDTIKASEAEIKEAKGKKAGE
ncbi:DUF4382 domain-containing protein [Chloroflexota bacterium]